MNDALQMLFLSHFSFNEERKPIVKMGQKSRRCGLHLAVDALWPRRDNTTTLVLLPTRGIWKDICADLQGISLLITQSTNDLNSDGAYWWLLCRLRSGGVIEFRSWSI